MESVNSNSLQLPQITKQPFLCPSYKKKVGKITWYHRWSKEYLDSVVLDVLHTFCKPLPYIHWLIRNQNRFEFLVFGQVVQAKLCDSWFLKNFGIKIQPCQWLKSYFYLCFFKPEKFHNSQVYLCRRYFMNSPQNKINF